MREICTSGSEGGGALTGSPYLYNERPRLLRRVGPRRLLCGSQPKMLRRVRLQFGSMGQPLSRGATAATILVLLAPAAQLFVAVHESGHALAALALGATIRDVHVCILTGKPHVSYAGLPDVGQAIVLMSGPGLMLLAWLAWLLTLGRTRSVWHEKLLFMSSVGALFPLLLWSIMPVLYASGRRVRDDSVLFVEHAGANPYGVAIGAFAFLAGCVWFFSRRVDIGEMMRARLTPIVSVRFHAVLVGALALGIGAVFLASR